MNQERQGEFGIELRLLRKKRGISLAGLARLAHYSKGHLNNIERGTRKPSWDLAQRCDTALSAGGYLQQLVLRGEVAATGGVKPVLSTQKKQESSPGASVTPYQMPPVTRIFVGRSEELQYIDAVIRKTPTSGRATVIVVHGKAGTGKTELVLQWAHRAKHGFPDGTFFLPLSPSGTDQKVDSASALHSLLESLEVPADRIPTSIPARTGLFRSLTENRCSLFILDDASDAAQIRPLLPAAKHSVVLVTSRRRLTDLVVRESARDLRLGPLSEQESVELLSKLLSVPQRGSDALPLLHEVKSIAQRSDNRPLALHTMHAYVASGVLALDGMTARSSVHGDLANCPYAS